MRFIHKLFKPADDSTEREYWIMTEVFVYLHNGHDYCEKTSTLVDFS